VNTLHKLLMPPRFEPLGTLFHTPVETVEKSVPKPADTRFFGKNTSLFSLLEGRFRQDFDGNMKN